MKKLFVSLVAVVMLFGTVGLASATTLTTDLYDVIAAPGAGLVDIGGQVAEYDYTSLLTAPSGGTIGFSTSVQSRRVGSSWQTWPTTYGPVAGLPILFTGSGVTSLGLTFSPDVAAFGFELEPNIFSTFEFRLTLDDGSVLTQTPDGSAGALAYGFTGGHVTSLDILDVSGGAGGFAIGRLYHAPVPEPATLLLLGSGLIGLAGFGRKKKEEVC